MAISFSCRSDRTGSTLTVDHVLRGPAAGSTRFDIRRSDGSVTTMTLLNRDQALQLAEFLMEQDTAESPKPPYPTFEVTGYALRVMCNGNTITTLTDGDCTADLGNMLSLESIRKAFPEYSSGEYYFAIYPYREGISRESTDRIISTCMDYQRAALISGNLKVCRPMTQLMIEKITGIDNTTISRAVRGTKIFTSHRNYSLETGICSLDYPSLFDEGIRTEGGDVIGTLGIKVMMNAIIEMEDKSKPLSDEDIKSELERYGYFIKRRTVVKYRQEALGLPNSRERRIKE